MAPDGFDRWSLVKRKQRLDWGDFMLNIGVTDSVHAEFWGVCACLYLSKSLSGVHLIFELHVLLVVEFLKRLYKNYHSMETLIKNCLDFIK